MKSKNDEIIFKAELRFKGSVSDFKNVLTNLNNLGIDGLKIGTWPTPERGAKGIMIDTVPLPEKRFNELIVGTSPLPEVGVKGIMIDTVPLPEKRFNGLIIATWPILEKNGRFGIIPMPEKGLSHDLEKDLIDGMPSFKINTDIYGGIRTAHLHIKDKIYLINRDRFKEHVEQIALEIMRDLTERIEEFSSEIPIPT